MVRYRIAICDDSQIAVDTVKSAVTSIFSQHELMTDISTFTDPNAFADFCSENHVDLALLDIEMPDIDGIRLGKLLRKQNDDTEIIYISNREDKVFQAFTVHPFGFVRKNHFLKDIESTITSYIEQVFKRESAKEIIVVSEGGTRSVTVNTIMYFEGSGAYQQMHLIGEKPVRITSRMKNLEDELAGEGFIRIHKGYLVSCAFIKSIKTGVVVMKNNEELPISRGKTQSIKEQYLAYGRENGMMLF